MKCTKAVTLSVSTLALAAVMFSNSAKAATAPVYNPATAVTVSGVIAAVSNVPSGQALDGVHVMVKSNNGNFDVYLGPQNFMSFLKMRFAVGDGIDVAGSRVKAGNAEVILARQVSDGSATITLRDSSGAEVWKNWGVVVSVKTT